MNERKLSSFIVELPISPFDFAVNREVEDADSYIYSKGGIDNVTREQMREFLERNIFFFFAWVS